VSAEGFVPKLPEVPVVEGQDVDGQEGVGGGVGGYCIAYSAATKQDQGVERAGQDADEPTIAVEEAEEEGANRGERARRSGARRPIQNPARADGDRGSPGNASSSAIDTVTTAARTRKSQP